MNAAQHHAISYIEFGVTDLDATKAFYQEASGGISTTTVRRTAGSSRPMGRGR